MAHPVIRNFRFGCYRTLIYAVLLHLLNMVTHRRHILTESVALKNNPLCTPDRSTVGAMPPAPHQSIPPLRNPREANHVARRDRPTAAQQDYGKYPSSSARLSVLDRATRVVANPVGKGPERVVSTAAAPSGGPTRLVIATS